MGAELTKATATCPVEGCGHAVHQIDTTLARAVQVVTEAIHRHLAEEHPDYKGEA